MSHFYPLPASTPIMERARIMVSRGECRTFSEAMRKLSAKRPTVIHSAPQFGIANPPPDGAQSRVLRLPYKDD